MKISFTQVSDTYSQKNIFHLQEIVDNFWYDFQVLIEVYEQTLYKRSTKAGRELKTETESRLEEIVQQNSRNAEFLLRATEVLARGTTNFASYLHATVLENLTEIENSPFPYPSVEIELKYRTSGKFDRRDRSILGLLGYQRGRKAISRGINKSDRRSLLRFAYEGNIAKEIDRADVVVWGRPRTSQRLRKIVYTLAHLINQERANVWGDYNTAILHGKTDLEFLKRTFYDGVYDWEFPEIN